jgi:hypothetical protein
MRATGQSRYRSRRLINRYKQLAAKPRQSKRYEITVDRLKSELLWIG